MDLCEGGDAMKNEKILLVWELFVTQMNHWILFLIPVTVLGIAQRESPTVWIWMLMGVLPYLFFLVRKFTNHFLIFVLAHGIAAAGFIWIPYKDIIEQIAVYVFVAIYLIWSFCIRLKSENRQDPAMGPALATGLPAGLFLLQTLLGYREWQGYYMFALILYWCLNYLQMYLERYEYFLVVNDSSTTNIPQRAIFWSGLELAGIFTAAVTVLLMILSGIGSDISILGKIKWLLATFINWAVGDAGRTPPAPEAPEESVNTTPDSPSMPFESTGPALFWVILQKITIVAVVLGSIVLVGYAVYKAVTYLKNRFRIKLTRIQEAEEADVKDFREKVQIERIQKEKGSVFSFFQPRDRIRRIYKKEIWAMRWKITREDASEVLKKMTARECGEKAERKELAQIYEKARYSQYECTSEDIREAKKKSV